MNTVTPDKVKEILGNAVSGQFIRMVFNDSAPGLLAASTVLKYVQDHSLGCKSSNVHGNVVVVFFSCNCTTNVRSDLLKVLPAGLQQVQLLDFPAKCLPPKLQLTEVGENTYIFKAIGGNERFRNIFLSFAAGSGPCQVTSQILETSEEQTTQMQLVGDFGHVWMFAVDIVAAIMNIRPEIV